MERLKLIIEKHKNWEPYKEYILRIEGYTDTDFTLCIENAKALLEGISKEICSKKGIVLDKNSKMSGLLKTAFKALGYNSSSTILQVGTSIANVAQQMGNFRNEIGATAHGKTADELRNRQNSIQELTGYFLLDATSIVSCFLIEAYETDNQTIITEPENEVIEENLDFNNHWDDQYGEFEMGDYSFLASQILYNVDRLAYQSEVNTFISSEEEMQIEE